MPTGLWPWGAVRLLLQCLHKFALLSLLILLPWTSCSAAYNSESINTMFAILGNYFIDISLLVVYD